MSDPSSAAQQLTIPCRAGHQLAGTLHLPTAAEQPLPVVIIVHGAAGQLRPDYQHFADAFLASGMGVFIYDKRGWGFSTGEPGWSDIDALADDLVDVVNQLHTHPAIRSLGLCGFSNGGWVAPLAASRVEDHLRFLIACSASGVPPARQEQYRRGVVAAQQLGATPQQVARIEAFWAHAFDLFATGKWTAEFEQLLAELEQDEAIQALPKEDDLQDGLHAVPAVYAHAAWREKAGAAPHMRFDALPLFRALSLPVLSIWGQQDTVIPLEESIAAMRAAMHEHPDYTALIIPHVGHMLTSTDETPHLPAEMQAQMTDWAWRRA